MKITSETLLGWILSAVVCGIITFYFDFFTHVNPNIESIQEDLKELAQNSANMDRSLYNIENRYLTKDEDGCECFVGVSSEMTENYVSVYKGNRLNLKSNDIIYITNPYGKFTPTVKFVVYLIDNAPNNSSQADLYVSKLGIDRLDVPRDQMKRGIFKMTIKRQRNGMIKAPADMESK